jgi:hypothetical protein
MSLPLKSISIKILLRSVGPIPEFLGATIRVRRTYRVTPQTDWTKKEFADGKLVLLERFETDLKFIEELLVNLQTGILICDLLVQSNVDHLNRFFIGQGEASGKAMEFPNISPFRESSATTYEYWNSSVQKFDTAKEIEDLEADGFDAFGLDLRAYPEKIGNIFVVYALDNYEFHCHAVSQGRFRVENKNFNSQDLITLVVRVKANEKLIATKAVPLTKALMEIQFNEEYNYFEGEFYDSEDHLVAHQAFYLFGGVAEKNDSYSNISEIKDPAGKFIVNLPTMGIEDESKLRKTKKEKINDINQEGKRLRTLITEKRNGTVFDFEKNKISEFHSRVIELILNKGKDKPYVYFCDPYLINFMVSASGNDFFKNLSRRHNIPSLRFLCSEGNNQKDLQMALSETLVSTGVSGLFRDMEFRAISSLKPDGKKTGFHNRWITAPRGTTHLITNSLTGISEDGATIVKVPTDFFFAQAEDLWNTVATNSVLVSTQSYLRHP